MPAGWQCLVQHLAALPAGCIIVQKHDHPLMLCCLLLQSLQRGSALASVGAVQHKNLQQLQTMQHPPVLETAWRSQQASQNHLACWQGPPDSSQILVALHNNQRTGV